MENYTGLLIIGSVVSGIKLLWALTVPVILYLICRKIKSFVPTWIIYSLIFVAFANLHNVVPVFLSRILSVTHYSYVMMFSNMLNAAGAIAFLAAAYGMASIIKKMQDEKRTITKAC